MSELIDNNDKRKELLKYMILKIHKGDPAEAVKKQLIRLLGKIPYGTVVKAEQELISEGLPVQEVLKLCDVHGEVLKGVIDHTEAKQADPGHPVHTFSQENHKLREEISKIETLCKKIANNDRIEELWLNLRQNFNNLMDIDKHYRRKENLLFPYLEKYEITGPPTVMWGKDDEIRELLKGAIETLAVPGTVSQQDAQTACEMVLKPAITMIDEMIYKEEEILFPMCMDTLTELEWWDIYQQSNEIGYCLYDPKVEWQPDLDINKKEIETQGNKIQLPTGNFTPEELSALFQTLPVDITFVDQEDKVRFFSNNPDRIFDRNRAILGRKVQMCHPPSSVHIVQKILDDFRSGRQCRAAFQIYHQDRYIQIEYFALKNSDGHYIGTLEVSQDLTDLQKLKGEQRLLNYQDN